MDRLLNCSKDFNLSRSLKKKSNFNSLVQNKKECISGNAPRQVMFIRNTLFKTKLVIHIQIQVFVNSKFIQFSVEMGIQTFFIDRIPQYIRNCDPQIFLPSHVTLLQLVWHMVLSTGRVLHVNLQN